jgi:arabinogalactan endo-1,4-beta-galactosidase
LFNIFNFMKIILGCVMLFLLFLLCNGWCANIGGDLSLLPQYIDAKAVFKNSSGNTVDPLPFLKGKGFNYVRCRTFVNPSLNTETGQDVNYVISFAKQVKSAGLKFMLDFHYSDSWADPGQQTKPSAWKNLAASALPGQVYSYTKSTLQSLKDAGITPDSIKIGNEITFGMLWNDGRVGVWDESWNTNTQWNLFYQMLGNASKACREVFSSSRIIIHTERSGDVESSQRFYQKMSDGKIDYDVIGLSYYPFWHGTLSDFDKVLSMFESSFSSKEIMIVEVAYPYNDWGYPSDSKYSKVYASTQQGQADFTKAFVAQVKKHSKVTSIFWWFPEETYSPNKKITTELHRGLFSNVDGNT